MKCAYPPCPVEIERPRKGQRFHEVSCRWADWRRRHPPVLQCPNCGIVLRLAVAVEEAAPESHQRRTARQNTGVSA